MNTLLKKLFDTYNISPKNRYDISQVYSLLPPGKQKNLIHNFEILSDKMIEIEKGLKVEREILIPKAVKNVTAVLEEVKKERIWNEVWTFL
jgi:hypothetical protein